MHYFGLIPVAGGLALAGTWLLKKHLRPLPEAACTRIMVLFSAAVFLVYLALGWWKYGAFQFGLWDFGIYDSFMHNMASGHGFMRDFRGGLYDHFSPVMLLLVPFYWIWDTPLHLIWSQSAALAAGIPIMYFLAKRYLKDPAAALVLAVLYALNPYYSRLALFDYHSECLFPAVFLAGFLARAYHRHTLAVILWMSCIFIKEDFAVSVAALGLYFLLSRGERKTGLLLLGWSVLSVILILKVYFPLCSANGYWHYGRYPLLGDTAAATVQNILAMAGRVFCADSFVVFASLLLPFALLPVLHWKMLLFVIVPTLGIQLASASAHQQLLVSHYSSALIGVIPLAALWGMRVLRAKKQKLRPETLLFILLFGAVFHITCCDLPLTRYNNYIQQWSPKLHYGILSLPLRPAYYLAMLEQDIRGGELHELLKKLPAGSRVAVQNELGCPLLLRHTVYSLPGPDDADYYLFSQSIFSGYESPAMLNDCIRKQLARPGYRLLFFSKGHILIGKGAAL